VTRGKAYLIGGIAVAVFIAVAVVLGAAVLFAAVAFLIGPHGSGIFPEWSNPLVLVFLAGGVGYVSYKAAIWTHMTLTRRMGAM
jgi:hypothetical protein